MVNKDYQWSVVDKDPSTHLNSFSPFHVLCLYMCVVSRQAHVVRTFGRLHLLLLTVASVNKCAGVKPCVERATLK